MLTFSFTLVSAHQPRIVYKLNFSQENLTIENPEISQAFYGELKGMPDHYEINSTVRFNLYMQILSPYSNESRKDFDVKITNGKETWFLNGSNYIWTRFYEEFAGDMYYQGPTADAKVPSGLYRIEVSNKNSNNTGKYILVVGKKEEFPVKEMIKAFFVMPRLKIYFGKSVLTSYSNMIGVYSFIVLLILTVIIAAIVLMFRKKNETMPF